ncbi:JAB domain-containing protein [Chryseobacterium wanjuense]
MTSSLVDVRLVLSVALKCLATGIILVHNHPSGNLKPSSAD